METYLWQSRHTCLSLLVFAALTAFGHAEMDRDITIEDDGLVKVYYNGNWKVICVSGKEFTVLSKVLCKSFSQKYSSHSSSYSYLQDSLRNLECRGDENSLSACSDYYVSSYRCYSKLHVQCQEDSTKAFCSFDNGMCQMFSEGTKDYKWQRVYPYGQPEQAGPKSDHTTESSKGKYMFASAAGFPGQKTNLKTKPFIGNISSVSFYYHMFGRDMGSLNVYIQTNNSSKKSIGSISGDQGIGWKHMCLPVNEVHGSHEIIFEAIKGEGYDSDIALDDVTLSENSCTNYWNVSCDFEDGTCGYDIENKQNIRSGWRIQVNTTKYSSGNYLQFSSYYYKTRHTIKSPVINIPNEEIKLEFRYRMLGTEAQELQVRFVEDGIQPLFTEAPYVWQDSGNHRDGWQYGCMYLPSKRGRIIVTAIAENGNSMGLDDFVLDKGYCRTGITHHKCTFDNPLLCEYEITCMNPNEYTWRRKSGKTSSYNTGPDKDNSKDGNGYYMYTEASNGNVNDTARLKFPVSNTKGKHLKFDYHMYGTSIGQLDVVFITNQSSEEEIVWSRNKNFGKYWQKECLYMEKEISEIIFVSVRGYSYQGDIAIDNVIVEEKGCPGPFDCDFRNGYCKYRISSNYFSWYFQSDYSYDSYSNRYLYFYSRTNYENAYFKMQSPQADVKGNSSITFKYKITGNLKKFALITYDSYSQNEMWSSNLNDITEFITACVNFPNSTKFGLIFQGTADVNSRYKTYAYLDDIEVHNETCKLGLTYHFCKFKEVHLCNFHVECPMNTRYNWSRGSSSDYHGFPPLQRYYYNKYYYMYVDSINGKLGDKTHLSFPNVIPPKGHSLYFDYYLQQGSGKLQVDLKTAKGKKHVFEEYSVVPSSVWQYACVQVTNEDTDIEFIATNGYGLSKYIGLTNVGFLEKECEERSISCDFSKGKCQYNNLNYYSTWERINSRIDTNLTDGFYMKTRISYFRKSLLVSPTENITNSCVQIRYKILNKNCNLSIYNAFNNHTILSMVSDDTTPWLIAQMYIQQETTKLVFLASVRNGVCTVLLDYVNIRKNTCPQLVCPAGTKMCNNSYCYSESKICDRINDCSDGRDEMNCNTSIACDFTTKFYCGYKIINGWQLVLGDDTSLIHAPDSMQIINTKGTMLSPIETLEDSCVNIKFTAFHALTGNFSVISNHRNPNGTSHHYSWNEYFFSQRYGEYEVQFQLPAGTTFLTFVADIKTGGLAINSVTIFDGTCPELNCSKNSHKCLDNSKCINEKNLCNNHKNCKDGSDEANCSKYFNCDFEDSDMCGFKSYPQNTFWIANGMDPYRIPSLDHSEGTYEGWYVVSNSSEESRLIVPDITIEDTFCFSFHYMFYGNGTVSVYDNGTHLMSLSKFDYDMWRGINITMPGGTHNIYFAYSKENSTSGAMALDSVLIIPGRCLHKRCEENWYPCNNNATCYSFAEICDGTDHCPGGEDEYNCSGDKRKYKLTRGRTLLSGRVEKLYGSEYIPVCRISLSDDIVNDICFELGANATTTQTSIRTYIFGKYYNYYSYYYNSYNRWNVYTCSHGCYCSTPYVTCSNTTCENGEVRCPPTLNETNSKNVCIRKESICNGEIDCEGGTDEKNCASCATGHWKCRDLKCIKQGLRCDSKKDCDDGSDEFYCFSYINKTIKVYHNGSYQNICEKNLIREGMANHLCSAVGRSNGTFGDSIEGYGVQFTENPSGGNMGLIPGFKANSFEKCKYMVLKCNEQVCGTRKRDLFEPNIQNGQNALPGEWPWAVQLVKNNRSICTASLLSKHYVLTAAHCVDSYNSGRYSVRVGSIKRGKGEVYYVTHVFIHDNYTEFIKGYDMALLYVESGITMTDYVQPICLPENFASSDKNYYAVGWGRNEKREYLDTLQETNIGIVEYQDCQTYFSEITEAVICGNNKEFYSPICFGDSGGPLQTLNGYGQWEVQGVASFVQYDCRGSIADPGGYTSVYHGIEWIKKYVN